MNLLLAFAPFIVFAVVDRLVGIPAGLAAGAVAAAALLIRDLIAPGRRVKLLEIGAFLLFGGLTLLELVMGEQWSIADVRLRVDAGLLLIVLLTMVLADVLMAYVPLLPTADGVVATVVALWAAAWFTGWYPEQRQRRTAGRT